MSKIKTKELIICVATLTILVLSIFTDVFATDNDLINNLLGSQNKNVPEIPIGNNTTNNTNNNTNNNANNNNTNNSNTNKTTIPNTGVDYSTLVIVAVCGISAIYAYKKINDYKNF